MHHLGAALDAEDQQNVAGGFATNFLGILGVIGDEAAADLVAVRTAHDYGIAARERALDLDDADRQETVATAQRRDRARVDRQRAFRLERACNPFLARGYRIGWREKPAATPGGDRTERMLDASRRDHHVDPASGGDLAGFDLGRHAAARKLRARRARHALDLGRDALDHWN